MTVQTEFWPFVSDRLGRGRRVAILVVAASSGSSPGRAGYKMAVAEDGELRGSIGGGVMEVNLVERAREVLSNALTNETADSKARLIEQEHRSNSPHASGMICSGRQTVILQLLAPDDLATVRGILEAISGAGSDILTVTESGISCGRDEASRRDLQPGRNLPIVFERDEDSFSYVEHLMQLDSLFIIGGGHCALALSELMSKLGFRIWIFDDRPSLNTIEKNAFADEITIIDDYDKIADHIPNGDDVYVVVMTLGYVSDGIVIRQLIDHDVRYLGVLGSRAKMATLMKELRDQGLSPERLKRIHTPIGIPINSRTPAEIAVSIAAEVISVRNAD